jgi:SNF2 family DNA or RNA helicase
MKNPLWTKQVEAFEALVGLETPALLMDMGTGKTIVQLALLEHHSKQRILVVCPKYVVDVWPVEIDKHASLPYVVCAVGSGSAKQRAIKIHSAFLRATNEDRPLIVVINYESVWRPGLRKTIEVVPWDAIVCDESHRIKAANSKVSKYMYHLGKRVGYRSIMTGTPVANTPLDVYGQYRFLGRHIYYGMTFHEFKMRYAIWGGFEGRVPIRFINLDELRKIMHSVAFTVKIDEVVDLPEGVTTIIAGQLESAVQKTYDQLAKEFVVQTDNGYITVENALTKMLRLHQLAGGWAEYDEGNGEVVSKAKRKLCEEVLMDLGAERVIIFTRFVNDAVQAKDAAWCTGYETFELTGSANELEMWKGYEDGAAALIVQIQAGSEGIDLTQAHHVIYYSIGYSLGEYNQSKARTRRPGQTKAVQYIHLAMSGTVDEAILDAIHRKQDIAEYVSASLRSTRP